MLFFICQPSEKTKKLQEYVVKAFAKGEKEEGRENQMGKKRDKNIRYFAHYSPKSSHVINQNTHISRVAFFPRILLPKKNDKKH